MPALPGPDAEIEALYRLPIAGFVAARDSLAARCRSAGDREGALRVTALEKPSASDWAVNQLHSWDRAALERFVAAARQARGQREAERALAAVRAAGAS